MRVETPEIYTDLERRLVTAQLKSEERIKPADLQQEYGVSANTVREVLLRLSMVGLVDFENQRGFRVAQVTTARRCDVARFRIMLEQEGVTLSMNHGGVAWESRVSAAHHKLKHIETQVARDGMIDVHMALWSEAEVEFHETLISACGSPLLRATYANVYVQFRQQMVGLEPNFSPPYFSEIVMEHQVIHDAALARDATACRTAIANHLARHVREEGMSSSR